MYIGVLTVLLGEAVTFRSAVLLGYATFFCVPVETVRGVLRRAGAAAAVRRVV
jgi:hypothetical protein